jgi:1-acyl-sn-glycerol-3-phosphate acyltransferase
MFRTLWAAIVTIVVTIPCATAVLLIAMMSSESPWIEPVIRFWARGIVWGAGIDLRSEGVETIDRAKRYILIANHHSYFDIPCIFAAIPQPIRFMAKKSLFSIPLFGWAIGRAGFIPIDR